MPLAVAPDAEGYLSLDSIGVRIKADGQHLTAHVAATGEPLRTSPELAAALEGAEQARQQAEQRADVEAAARKQMEEEVARLRAELARLQSQ